MSKMQKIWLCRKCDNSAKLSSSQIKIDCCCASGNKVLQYYVFNCFFSITYCRNFIKIGITFEMMLIQITFIPLLHSSFTSVNITNSKVLEQTLITCVYFTLFDSVRFFFSLPLSLSFVQRQTAQSYTNTHSSSSVKIKRNLFYKMKPLENYIHLNHIILIRCEIRSLRPNAEIADFQSYFHFLVALHRRLEQIFPFAK